MSINWSDGLFGKLYSMLALTGFPGGERLNARIRSGFSLYHLSASKMVLRLLPELTEQIAADSALFALLLYLFEIDPGAVWREKFFTHDHPEVLFGEDA